MKKSSYLKPINCIKEEYSKGITKGFLGFPHRKRYKDLLEICSRFKQLAVLDIGCNDLFSDKDIIPYQNVLVGCDLNWENGLYIAKENIDKNGWNNVHIIKSIGEYLPLRNNLFDLILCFETLEHVDDEYKVIKEIQRVSKGNAMLIISIPIELGPILLLKQLFRYIVYRESYFDNKEERYSLRELFYAGILCNLNPAHVGRYRHSHKAYIPHFRLAISEFTF